MDSWSRRSPRADGSSAARASPSYASGIDSLRARRLLTLWAAGFSRAQPGSARLTTLAAGRRPRGPSPYWGRTVSGPLGVPPLRATPHSASEAVPARTPRSGAPVGGRGSSRDDAPSTPGQGSRHPTRQHSAHARSLLSSFPLRRIPWNARWRGGREVRQGPAKPRTAVRVRSAPSPFDLQGLQSRARCAGVALRSCPKGRDQASGCRRS